MNIRHVVAIDLSASSGRVMLACYNVHNKKLSLDEIHRFTNHLITKGEVNGHYRVLKNIMRLWLFQRICLEHDVQDICSLIAIECMLESISNIFCIND
ncbi:TPA: hypothetical protein KEY68_003143 [Providencia rettgeri]|nr:hypothetical protein [Providencia rettgeri]MBQ0368341.1 hypothetical protein [Providencia rettgeri]HBC7430849.1 hypothetical protein [Providencia rettgeri]